MLLKPNKSTNEVSSYRPISLLSTLAKLYEKVLIERLNPIIDSKKLIPVHQFGFRENHSTIEQVLHKRLRKYGIEGLNLKLRRNLPKKLSEIIKSYLADRYFRVKHEDQYSELKKKVGLPQGSVLGQILYLLYTRYIPTTEAKIATLVDNTAILAVGTNIEESDALFL